MVIRSDVQSASVLSLGYDKVTNVLEVEFQGGKIYRYVEVPQEVYASLMNAESIGRFVNREIKGIYEVIPPDQTEAA
jgi:hypothetical protein